ncbi:MAG: hypothetical protein MZV70_56285 [Desulfobacterales bacterium]|nr:hypothetical protein [Desulfobacterales bacterium]
MRRVAENRFEVRLALTRGGPLRSQVLLPQQGETSSPVWPPGANTSRERASRRNPAAPTSSTTPSCASSEPNKSGAKAAAAARRGVRPGCSTPPATP